MLLRRQKDNRPEWLKRAEASGTTNIEEFYRFALDEVTRSGSSAPADIVDLVRLAYELRLAEPAVRRELIEKAKSEMPTEPQVYYIAALAAMRDGDPLRARAEIAVAMALATEDSSARFLLAQILMLEGYDEAGQQVLSRIRGYTRSRRRNTRAQAGPGLNP